MALQMVILLDNDHEMNRRMGIKFFKSLSGRGSQTRLANCNFVIADLPVIWFVMEIFMCSGRWGIQPSKDTLMDCIFTWGEAHL